MDFETAVGFMVFGAIATSFAGWVTHIIVCIGAEAWGLLIAGAIFFPIGIIHGVGCWFGAW